MSAVYSPEDRRFCMGSRFLSLWVITLVAVFVLFLVPSASAAPSSMPDEGTVQADGRVNAILLAGNRIYLGGEFTHVNGVSREHLAALNASTGKLTSWAPRANGPVRALAASSDGSRIYAGGSFTYVNGRSRKQLAALDPTTGSLDPNWTPNANYTVYALAVVGNRVYLGGAFTAVNGQGRSRLARVNTVTGALNQNWRPTANATVRRLLPSKDGSRIYAGGQFTSISSQERLYLAALSQTTGALKAWRPAAMPNGFVYDLAESNGRVYTAEGGQGGAASAYNIRTGARTWRTSADGDVQAVAVLARKVYVGGHFDVVSGQTRHAFATVAASTGALDRRWTPSANPSWPGVWSLTKDAARGRLYAGGSFTHVSGRPHHGFARFSE